MRAGKSKKLAGKQSEIGQRQALNRRIRLMAPSIEALKAEAEQYEAEMQCYTDLVRKRRDAVRYQKAKYQMLKAKKSSWDKKVKKKMESRYLFSLSKAIRDERLKKPTDYKLDHTSKCTRRDETIRAAAISHGASADNPMAAICGLLDTAMARCKSEDLVNYIIQHGKHSLVKVLKKKYVNGWASRYNRSHANMIRSLNTYYSPYPTGKTKYMNQRRAGIGSFEEQRLPNLVAYRKLALYIRSIDIGTVVDINPVFTTELGTAAVEGRYRPALKHLPALAKFYLEADNRREDKLLFFDKFEETKKDPESKLFQIALGGDGAPICGTSILVSFLNVGERIPCSMETFLLFGTDAGEQDKVVLNYIRFLMTELAVLESQVFTVDVDGKATKVEFRVAELPNDLKMLCWLAGELTNSAYYFTTFAKVNESDVIKLNVKFPQYSYEERCIVAAKVALKKEELAKKKVCDSTKRDNLTTYIRSLKSRQEFEPLVGRYVDLAKYEPLHGKNNTVKERFVKLLHVVFYNTPFPGKVEEFSKLSKDLLFVEFVFMVHTVMKCNGLAKSLKAWYNDGKGKPDMNDFKMRFRGKESRAFLTHFPELISRIIQHVKAKDVLKVLRVHWQCVCLRQLVSFSVRISSITEEDLLLCEELANKMHKSCAKFDQNYSPTMWNLCNVMPQHSRKTFEDYGFGIGCNTMEGREQKHQMIAKYQAHSTFANRWEMTFRHEYIHLVYIPSNGYDRLRYRKRSVNYVPKQTDRSCPKCAMLFKDIWDPKVSLCPLCDHSLMSNVEKELN